MRGQALRRDTHEAVSDATMIRRHRIVARRAHSAECSATGWSSTCTPLRGSGTSGLRERHHPRPQSDHLFQLARHHSGVHDPCLW